MKSYFYRLSPSVLPLVFFLFFVNLVSSKSHSTKANFINSGNSVELLSSKSNSYSNQELLFFENSPSKSAFPTQSISEALESWEESDSDDDIHEFTFLGDRNVSYVYEHSVLTRVKPWPYHFLAITHPLHKLLCVYII